MSVATRSQVEDFVFAETALLDEWRLDEWLELFLPEGRYRIPCLDIGDREVADAMILLDDDMDRLRARVKRLNSRRAYREFPWARVRHFVTNLRLAAETDDEVVATSNFQVRRLRGEDDFTFSGHYRHTLVPANGSFLISERLAVLDQEVLRPHGTIGIIL